jgi:TolA-binding protein
MECHSSRLEQVEDRISELEDKIEIKGKAEELVVKQLKTYKRNFQELSNSTKRRNLRIMGLEDGKRYKQKGFVIYSIK